MAPLDPEAPEYFGRAALLLINHVPYPAYTPTVPPAFFYPSPSIPYFPAELPPLPYNHPNTSFPFSSNLQYNHLNIQNPFHTTHGNLLPTQQSPLPSLSFTQPHAELLQVREWDDPHHVAPTAPKNSRFRASPRFHKNRRSGERQVQAVVLRGTAVVRMPKGSGNTTFMIKNIPYKYTEEMVLQFLDEHCRAENEKLIKIEGDGSDQDSMSAYDFFYLPIDFRTHCSRGYAFVNFTSESGATRFHTALNGYNWGAPGWNKTCEIAYARIQGKEQLIKHFERSNFYCETAIYLPVMFFSCRNGSCTFQASRLGNLNLLNPWKVSRKEKNHNN